MRRWRKPPNICLKPCTGNTGKSQNASCKNKIENKISKRPVSNGIRLKERNRNPKRNRALLILFRMGARSPPCYETHIHPPIYQRGVPT